MLNLAHCLRQEGRIVAFVDLEAQTAVQDLGSVEMYLAAMSALLFEVKKTAAPVPSDTFLDDKHKPMAEAPGVAILTIPLSLVYEPTFNVLSERYINADSAVLPAVRREHRLEGPGDVTNQLLYGLWVMEYRNGIAWYRLPEPVEQLLQQLERAS